MPDTALALNLDAIAKREAKNGNEAISNILRLVAIEIRKSVAEIATLRTALAPFSWYYSVNDCAETDQQNMEVPVSDLRRAFEAHPVTDPRAFLRDEQKV